jgi:dipeptidyl aminopeptidase/acylaminoacyl peptidase
VAKPPYKLVVMPHGGPHYRASTSAGFNALVLASHGYAVLEPNFRGSTGYGKAFLDADHSDFGGGDMRDILAGADELIRQGVADAKRQFVHGVSYGGFMSSWIITQTDRFRAAVPQNPVTDLTMMWCLSDLQSWTEYEFGGKPWDKPEAYRAHSPLTFAAKVKTPTLILQSENDRRCPLPMAIAYHQALKAAGVETMLVTYPNEPHGIKQPAHRADALRRTIDWFDRHSQ